MLKVTRYEYEAPIQVAGVPRDFTTNVKISQAPAGWTATIEIKSVAFPTVGDAQKKLRDELTKLISILGSMGTNGKEG